MPPYAPSTASPGRGSGGAGPLASPLTENAPSVSRDDSRFDAEEIWPLLGEPEDARSDLFSLGIVLYELLTGKRPFDATDDRAPPSRGRPEAVAPPSRIAQEIPASLDRAVRRCLAKLPSDRYADAAELRRLEWIFAASVRYEVEFWDMAYAGPTDNRQ